MEIKNSLTMPKTGFEMRGNLAQKEPKILERWKNFSYLEYIKLILSS